MPVKMDPYKGKYDSIDDLVLASNEIQNDCAAYLEDNKGYELIILDDIDIEIIGEKSSSVEGGDVHDLQEKCEKEFAGKHTAQIIKKIGNFYKADAVVAIHVEERKPWGGIEGLLNIALMNLPLFYQISSPSIGAWIYETKTGRLVWREEQSTFGRSPTNDTTITSEDVVNLFIDIENAVPKQLVETQNKPTPEGSAPALK